MDPERFNVDELAAQLNGHQVTDADGQVSTEEVETPQEESAPSEKPQVEETSQEEGVQPTDNPEEVVEDETTGNKFVPIDRFNKVYGRLKELEREKKASETAPQPEVQIPSVPVVDKTEALETEVLFTTMPEFNPESDRYSKELDLLGAKFYRAEPGITKMEAARKAKAFMKQLAQSHETAKSEVRKTKLTQSESGMAGRTQRPQDTKVNPDDMSLDEMEEYLKKSGQW